MQQGPPTPDRPASSRRQLPSKPPGASSDYGALREDAQQALDAGQVDEAVYILVLCCWHWPEIARAVGLPTWQDARRAFTRYHNLQQRQGRDIRQDNELRRLERLSKRLQPQIEAGNVEAIKTELAISESRRRLFADNEPERRAPLEMPSDEEIAAKAEVFARAAGIDPKWLAQDVQQRARASGLLPARVESRRAQDEEVEDAELVLQEEDDDA